MTSLITRTRRPASVALKLMWWLAVVTSHVAYLVDPQFTVISFISPPAWLRYLLAMPTLGWMANLGGVTVADSLTLFTDRLARTQKRAPKSGILTAGLINLAVLVAGRRRAHVREAWLSDLERPRDLTDTDAPGVSASKKVIYAVGLVRAGICYRIDDVTALWWHAVDGLLASRSWSRLVLVGPCAVALVMIVHREGLYGLVTNAGNLVAIGTASAGLVYGGRKVRKVTLKPTRHKQDQA